MSKYKFEEEVVEEKVEETTVEESAPDSHETFVNILVDMGLSAEQAEAVHQMAMDLIEASEGEVEVTEEVKEEKIEEKIEASRQRRGRRGGSRGRKQFNKEGREARMLSRLRRQNIELRKQLREFGQSPATKPLRNAPYGEVTEESNTTMSKATSQAFNMINKNLSK
jgi:adenylate kinase family enzyme